MPTVARLVNSPVSLPIQSTDTLTTGLLESAAALETKLSDSDRRIRSLTRELRRAQDRQERARQWIVALRRSHRTASHAKTATLFTYVLRELVALNAMPQVGVDPVLMSSSLFDVTMK